MAVPKTITAETLSTWAPDTLAELANDAGERAQSVAKQAVQHAIVAGNALNAAKSQIPHGEWMAWLKVHWNYSQDWANKLMRIANSECTLNLEESESISEVLELVDNSRRKGNESEVCDERVAQLVDEKEAKTEAAARKKSKSSLAASVEPYSIDDMEPDIKRAIAGWFRKVPESQYDELHGTIIEQLNERWVPQ